MVGFQAAWGRDLSGRGEAEREVEWAEGDPRRHLWPWGLPVTCFI